MRFVGGRRKITSVSMATSSLRLSLYDLCSKGYFFRDSMESVQPLTCMNTAHKGDGVLFLKENYQIQFCHTTCHDNEKFIYKSDESSNIIKNKSQNMNVTE